MTKTNFLHIFTLAEVRQVVLQSIITMMQNYSMTCKLRNLRYSSGSHLRKEGQLLTIETRGER